MMHDGHEFEDRDTQLPADPRPLGAGVRPGQLSGVPLGTPDIDYDVRSIYDVRPVNGFDFTFTQEANIVATGEDSGVWTFNFTVPTGLVAVVRWYQWLSIARNGGYSGALIRNGVNYPYNSDVSLRTERMPVYMLVDEEQTFGVRVVGSSLLGLGSASLTIHGNFLQKTGRAYPYEIANPTGAVRRSVQAPESLFHESHPSQSTPVPSQPMQAAPAPAPVCALNITWLKQTQFATDQLQSSIRALCLSAGNGMYWVPVVSTNGGRSSRGLTDQEARECRDFIQLHPPAGGGGSYSVSR